MMSQDDVTLEGLLYGSVHGNNSDGVETEAQVISHVGEENASANHIRVSQVPSFLKRFCLTVSLMYWLWSHYWKHSVSQWILSLGKYLCYKHNLLTEKYYSEPKCFPFFSMIVRLRIQAEIFETQPWTPFSCFVSSLHPHLLMSQCCAPAVGGLCVTASSYWLLGGHGMKRVSVAANATVSCKYTLLSTVETAVSSASRITAGQAAVDCNTGRKSIMY